MIKVTTFTIDVSIDENKKEKIAWFFGFPQEDYPTSGQAKYQFQVLTSQEPALGWPNYGFLWLGPIPDAFIQKLLEIYLQGIQGVTDNG